MITTSSGVLYKMLWGPGDSLILLDVFVNIIMQDVVYSEKGYKH